MKFIAFLLSGFLFATETIKGQEVYSEQYRPQIHFSPKAHWMNDPNGMVYYNGVYNLFFQYYPDSTVWGPMHWGHAVSKDLIHWQQKPIALYPDSIGYIYSGSAVVDKNNTSGLGKYGQAPLVAVFTSHNPVREKAHRNDYENQSLAFSLDDGRTWKKYDHNPVLKNPGITDFRDPKVMWYEPSKKWIMTLATKNKVTFYSSPDLKKWKKESDFGATAGAHGGVWECPDLFPLEYNGKKIWVLIVSINPGGPNIGSATQYFLGDFNGKNFIPYSTDTKWIDYGPDDYAGVTWSNTDSRKIFLGWMSNWLYAAVVPTIKWRSAMTIPRELKIKSLGKGLFVASMPVEELNKIKATQILAEDVLVKNNFEFAPVIKHLEFPCRIDLTIDSVKDFSIVLSNDIREHLEIGFDKKNNQFYINRSKSGKTGFQKDFAEIHTAPRFINDQKLNISLIFDESSIELFADDGLTVMTELFFPDKPFDNIDIKVPGNMVINNIKFIRYKSIWH